MSLRYVICLILFCQCAVVSCGTPANVSAATPPAAAEEYPDSDKTPKQSNQKSSFIIVYKSVGPINLRLYVYQPSAARYLDDKQTAIVFFHGGSWTAGSPIQFQRQALYLAEHGIVSITVEYRVKKNHGTTPFEALSDAKSAIRWVREHSADLNIDPHKIIASGGSAGGQLAAATAIIDNYNDPTDNLAISSIPNALVLFNPVLDTQRWKKRFGVNMLAVSPLQQLNKPLPSTIIFQGTDDKIAPYPTTVEFVNKALSLKSPDVRLIAYEKRQHAFYNIDTGPDSDFESTLKQAYDFVLSLGWQPEQ